MLQAIYSKNAKVIKRKIADELILVPVGKALATEQKIFSLNPVGEFIFDRINGKATLQEILQDLLAEFSVTKEQAEADILQFIDNVQKQGLIIKVN